jgi:ketosteroid isomerase-like protein
MSASTIRALYDAMESLDLAALAATFAGDVVVTEPSSLPYGGTKTGRDALFEQVFGYLLRRGRFSSRRQRCSGTATGLRATHPLPDMSFK